MLYYIYSKFCAFIIRCASEKLVVKTNRFYCSQTVISRKKMSLSYANFLSWHLSWCFDNKHSEAISCFEKIFIFFHGKLSFVNNFAYCRHSDLDGPVRPLPIASLGRCFESLSFHVSQRREKDNYFIVLTVAQNSFLGDGCCNNKAWKRGGIWKKHFGNNYSQKNRLFSFLFKV